MDIFIKGMKRLGFVFVSTIVVFNMTSCSYFDQPPTSLWRENITTFGPTPLIDRNSFEKIDLALLLNPKGEPIKYKDGKEVIKEKIDKAFDGFYKNPIDQEKRRNRIQERILAASVQRCGEYKNFLKQFESGTNFFLGSMTTAVAGAGAIFTGTDTVRALSGTAAILSGVRSEFNDDYFSRQTIQVLTSGFENEREELYGKMLKRRYQNITRYPVEAAIKDALKYHASCSLIAGLEQAALAIERTRNPGLIETQRALVEAKKLQRIMNAEPSEISTLNLASPIGLLAGGMAIPEGYNNFLDDELPQEVYATVRANVAFIEKEYESLSKKLKAEEFKDKSDKLDNLKKMVTMAKVQAWKVLLVKVEKKAEEMTARIQKAKAKVIETIDPGKRELLEIELNKERLNGKIIILETQKIHLECHLNYLAAEAALNNKSIDLNKRLEKAENDILNIIKSMIQKRLDSGLTGVNGKIIDSALKKNLKDSLNLLSGVPESEPKKEIEAIVKSAISDLKDEEAKIDYPIIKKAIAIADKIDQALPQ